METLQILQKCTRISGSLIKRFLMVFLVISLSQPIMAQDINETSAGTPGGPRAQLATIVFAGLAGAILGLSTLSFYGRPQDKLSNIAVGFAIGIIGGAVYTTYRTATSPYDYGLYKGEGLDQERQWDELMNSSDISASSNQNFKMNYTWEF